MDIIKIEKLTTNWKSQIFALWNNEYPERLNYKSMTDFEAYLENLTEQSHIVLVDDNQNVQGWYFDFIRADEKWFSNNS